MFILIWTLLYSIYRIINVENCIFTFSFVIFNMFKIYKKQKDHIKEFNNISINETKKLEQNSIVSQLLPQHVFSFLKIFP